MRNIHNLVVLDQLVVHILTVIFLFTKFDINSYRIYQFRWNKETDSVTEEVEWEAADGEEAAVIQ